MNEAKYFDVLADSRVQCHLCGHHCLLAPGALGLCKARKNVAGRLIAENYGQVVALAMDPIEKKPLYHFYPGCDILSIASYGCNYACPFCQNYDISQSRRQAKYMAPGEIVSLAKQKGSIGIAYTYSEPLMWFEYILDTARLAHDKGLKNVLVTNGDINAEPLADLLPLVDAANLDIKSMDKDFYRKYCKGYLDNVLNTARTFHKAGIHLEITNLLIPTLNDNDEIIHSLIDFVAQELASWVPLHFSRYFPHYKMHLPATPVDTLNRAFTLAKAKLDHVFVGNILLHPEWQNTACPICGKILIERDAYVVRKLMLRNGRCLHCQAPVHIVQ